MADVRPGRRPRTDSGILHAACSDPLRISAASLQMPGAGRRSSLTRGPGRGRGRSRAGLARPAGRLRSGPPPGTSPGGGWHAACEDSSAPAAPPGSSQVSLHAGFTSRTRSLPSRNKTMTAMRLRRLSGRSSGLARERGVGVMRQNAHSRAPWTTILARRWDVHIGYLAHDGRDRRTSTLGDWRCRA
jgi:hypothetical protein